MGALADVPTTLQSLQLCKFLWGFFWFLFLQHYFNCHSYKGKTSKRDLRDNTWRLQKAWNNSSLAWAVPVIESQCCGHCWYFTWQHAIYFRIILIWCILICSLWVCYESRLGVCIPHITDTVRHPEKGFAAFQQPAVPWLRITGILDQPHQKGLINSDLQANRKNRTGPVPGPNSVHKIDPWSWSRIWGCSI